MSIFDRGAAEKLGWSISIDGEDGDATREVSVLDAGGASLLDEGEPVVRLERIGVSSGTPLFSLLANIAEAEGVGFLEGYGGDQAPTPELVLKVSGETYEPAPQESPPPADPLIPSSVVVDAATQAALAAATALNPGLTKTQRGQVEAAVRSAAQAVVDDHFGA